MTEGLTGKQLASQNLVGYQLHGRLCTGEEMQPLVIAVNCKRSILYFIQNCVELSKELEFVS